MKSSLPTYEAFKTGLTYQDVARMLWIESDNPDDWKRKSKGVVLGIMHKIKSDMYEEAARMVEAEEFEAEHGYPIEWDEVKPANDVEAIDAEDDATTTTHEGEKTMAHELEKMIYVGETPWHGLGTHLEVAPTSTAEAVRLAGLDWQIALEQLQLADGTLVDRNAVVRQSDRAVLGTVGMGWEPVQNIEAFSPIEPFLSAGLATVETAGSLRGGRRVWMLAKVARPDSVIVPQADDRVAKYMLAAIGHDGTMAFRFGYSPTRVVCMNTLSVAIREGESTHVRIPHFSGIKKAIEAVSKTIEEVDARFEKTAEIFRALAAVKVKSAADLRQYVETVYHLAKPDATPEPEQEVSLSGLLQKPRAGVALPSVFAAEVGGVTEETRSRVYEEIARLFEFGKGNGAPGVAGTAWAAYNAVTEYNTWERGGSQDTRLDNVWMEKAGSVRRALPAAVAQFLGN